MKYAAASLFAFTIKIFTGKSRYFVQRVAFYLIYFYQICTAKRRISIKYFFSKYEQIHSFLQTC